MALTTNKKNKILADWKTGKFKSATALAKHYKVDPKTVKKILGNLEPTNADIVEVGALYENAKKSLKNPIEIKAVEKAVEERTIADEIEGIIFEGTMVNVIGAKKDLTPPKQKNEETGELEEVQGHLTMQDRKFAQETFDKALITIGKANRHAPKQDINLTQQQAQAQEQQHRTLGDFYDEVKDV